MKYRRKTRHDYWEFDENKQEMYLNLRYQIGYIKAGIWLKSQICMNELVPLFFSLAIASEALKIINKSKILK